MTAEDAGGPAWLVGRSDPAVRGALAGLGLPVEELPEPELALARLAAPERPSVLLLLPDLPRETIAAILRASRTRADRGPPVVVRVPRVETAERVWALELGADDAVGPEVRPRELGLRVRALLGRTRAPVRPPVTVAPDQPRVDPLSLRLEVGTERLRLTPTEARLVTALLVGGLGSVHARDALRRAVWGEPGLPEGSRALDALLGHLRPRLRGVGLEVATIRRAGVRLVRAGAQRRGR